MPFFERDNVKLYYEVHGEGFPLLLIAPGGLRSSIPIWESQPFNAITALSPHFRVIAMDQRNAGQSTAPVSAEDNWQTYTADQLGLLDHLGIKRTHVLGGCIGGPYGLGLIQAAPDRIVSAVLQQSIGLDNNREVFYGLFDSWWEEIEDRHQDVPDDAWISFRSNMFDGDFDFNVGRDFVRGCQTPLLVLMGNDVYHPQVTSREIAELAANATLIEQWRNAEEDGTVGKVVEFLKANTPEA